MESSLEELISVLSGSEMVLDFFNSIVEELVALEDGQGLKALRAVIMAKVRLGNVAKRNAVKRLINLLGTALPIEQRGEVLQTMSAGWDDLESEDLYQIFLALGQLHSPPCEWDLGSVKSQVDKVAVDTPSFELSMQAQSLSSCIRR